MRHDYKFLTEKKGLTASLFSPGKAHLILVSAIVAGFFLASSLLSYQADANKNESLLITPGKVAPQHIIENLPLPSEPQSNSLQLPFPVASKTDEGLVWKTIKVKPGENMAIIFSRMKISPTVLNQILHVNKSTRKLTHVLPGKKIKFQMNDKGELRQLVYQYNIANSLHIRKVSTGFTASTQERKLDTRIAHASARINLSLFLAGQSAGLSDNMTMTLANIFGWDIDFALDIRQGDHFTVIYEEIFMGDKKIRDGNILAAEFVNRGRTYRAIRYTDSRGRSQYYSPKGLSMRKAFLRTPVDFSRISSRFNLRRKHPVLNRIRAHKGVDYAARPGTPVKATGDGKIIFKGRKGGYGKTIVIKHGSAYSTLYAHMRSYNKKSRYGSRVKQGQIIGYIGSTGLATGPHLHYEFRVNGHHRNPLTVRLPTASPLPKKYLADFNSKAQTLVAQLNLIKNNTLALLQ
mgnify:CR=1 FL=1